MVTMVPRRSASMCGSTVRSKVNWESVFVRKVLFLALDLGDVRYRLGTYCSTSSAVEFRIDLGRTIPALLIRMVGGPSCSNQ